MARWPLAVAVWVVVILSLSADTRACQTPLALHHIPGNIHIAGLFAAHSGVNCSVLEFEGFQQLVSALSVVETLRQVNYIPGIDIGLSVYDTCSSVDLAHKAVINAIVQSECLQAISLGCISTFSTAEALVPLVGSLGMPVTSLTNPQNTELLSQLGIQVLLSRNIATVHWLLTSFQQQQTYFSRIASQHYLCIKRQALVSDLKEIPEGVIVIIAPWADLEDSLRIGANSDLLFLSTDGEVNFKSDRLPQETFAVVPSLLQLPATNSTTAFFTTEDVQAPLFIQVAADILQLLNSFKTTLAAYCPQGTICDNLPSTKERVATRPVLQTPHLVTFILNQLDIEDDQFDGYTLFHKIPDKTEFYEYYGSFKIIEDKWTFISDKTNQTSGNVCRSIPSNNITDNVGIDCTYCYNFDEIYEQHFEDIRQRETFHHMVVWRSESWVAAIGSVSLVGVLCAIAVATFILIRLCKRDILEGNPTFSFLLLLSIMFTYASILPFSFHVVNDHHLYKEILCTTRLFGTSLSYAMLFSIMLARSLMLASCDQDGGFMSHVNGYHQAVLCFFIAAVQIGLSLQFWVVNWKFLSENQCSPMTEGNLFIMSLCYDMLLLIFLVCTTPFIFRSKRNYHEGSYFAAASILCLLTWICWISGYIFLPQQYNDILVVSGLCGTATILLVTIFIPRTYLMMTGIVRDHLASALPSLAYQSSTSVVDVNYRSTQALYDSVNPISISRGQSNPNFYSDRPNTPSTSKVETIPRIRTTSPLPDNTYERYGTPPSPLNVTRF